MEAEAVLNLFDSSWFYHQIFQKQSQTLISSSPQQNPDRKTKRNSSKRDVNSIHTRSKSEQLIDISSSDPILLKPHLETILSDREISLEIPKKPSRNLMGDKKKKQKRLSKSLSELEFEELKGFMDLGFVFSEEDKDSSLVEIIPGLQRLGPKMDGGMKFGPEEMSGGPRARPYLSEAWAVWDKQKPGPGPFMKWRIPAVSNEIDMKDSLKCWAHTVASAVR